MLMTPTLSNSLEGRLTQQLDRSERLLAAASHIPDTGKAGVRMRSCTPHVERVEGVAAAARVAFAASSVDEAMVLLFAEANNRLAKALLGALREWPGEVRAAWGEEDRHA